MDSPDECRAIDFYDMYFRTFGEYEEDLDPEDFEDRKDYEEVKKDRIRIVRKKLGWR